MDQVEKAFSGRYREVNRETQQWYTYNHPVPEPRPGAVSALCWRTSGHILYMSVHSSMSCQLTRFCLLSSHFFSFGWWSRLELMPSSLASFLPKHDSYQTAVVFFSWQASQSWITEKCKINSSKEVVHSCIWCLYQVWMNICDLFWLIMLPVATVYH